jgi:hypothetical protein
LPISANRAEERCLTPAAINRTIELLRNMLNWAVGREYLEKTPFRRGMETLIKKLREDNLRRRRLSPDEELRLLAEGTRRSRPPSATTTRNCQSARDVELNAREC